jgi:hypothetical protein
MNKLLGRPIRPIFWTSGATAGLIGNNDWIYAITQSSFGAYKDERYKIVVVSVIRNCAQVLTQLLSLYLNYRENGLNLRSSA